MARSSTPDKHFPAIAGISYVFPAGTRTVRQMAGDGLLESSAETLESFGFERVHVAVKGGSADSRAPLSRTWRRTRCSSAQ